MLLLSSTLLSESRIDDHIPAYLMRCRSQSVPARRVMDAKTMVQMQRQTWDKAAPMYAEFVRGHGVAANNAMIAAVQAHLAQRPIADGTDYPLRYPTWKPEPSMLCRVCAWQAVLLTQSRRSW